MGVQRVTPLLRAHLLAIVYFTPHNATHCNAYRPDDVLICLLYIKALSPLKVPRQLFQTCTSSFSLTSLITSNNCIHNTHAPLSDGGDAAATPVLKNGRLGVQGLVASIGDGAPCDFARSFLSRGELLEDGGNGFPAAPAPLQPVSERLARTAPAAPAGRQYRSKTLQDADRPVFSQGPHATWRAP